MRTTSLALALSFLAFGAAAAEPPTEAPAPAAPEAAVPATTATPAPPKPICRTEKIAGTRMSRRVCRTPEEASEARKAGREFLDSGQRRLQDVRADGG